MESERFQLGHAGAMKILREWAKQKRAVKLMILGRPVATICDGILIESEDEPEFVVHEGSGIEHVIFPSKFNCERVQFDAPKPGEILIFSDQEGVAQLELIVAWDDQPFDAKIVSKYIH